MSGCPIDLPLQNSHIAGLHWQIHHRPLAERNAIQRIRHVVIAADIDGHRRILESLNGKESFRRPDRSIRLGEQMNSRRAGACPDDLGS